jgi:anaerobic selenocysteine-containing dehydrogenase
MDDRIGDPWGARTPYAPPRVADDPEAWPVRVDRHLENGLGEESVDRWVQSAAVLHSNGDGLDIAVKDGRIVGVRGRAVDRVNRGRVDPKDLYGWQANNSADRLTRPLIRQGGELVETDWGTAMRLIVERSQELRSGPGGWGRFGFYTSGQLFLEEYYTLAVIGKAGLGTPHMDGNTRLCTATAAAALKASFGTDGQPGSYRDVDACDAIALWGHNVAETQTVLWMRMLDRRCGSDPPRMLAVDPRPTPVAREADVHLAVRNGTNQALMNALLHEIIRREWYDRAYVDAHTLGFEELERVVSAYDPRRAAAICGIQAAAIGEAAELIGTSQRLLSTVLQGFYQSNQATAASCQVNNLHLLRGMIGRPGAGIYQMNGQPTAQNTRETGADGDLSGLRNWENPEHIRELAELWNVDEMVIPHWAPPTHSMQIFRYAEQGSIKLLWISATNPAVSMPELARIRRILAQDDLMVVVQDIFLTETARLADVVLPAAAWGEKLGTFTNVDRTVHLSERAVDPPGEARSDLDIFLDYARRMDFRDRDGAPLIKWHDPESGFEAWKACSAGRPCDYTGITYDRLRGGSGTQWPCTAEAPDGTERLYVDGHFNTDPDYSETFGHDLSTGAALGEQAYRAKNPAGRAFLHAADHEPFPESPDGDYPLLLTTGRTLYHFHTRTKTGRAPELQAAAPDVWVELSPQDAHALAIGEGDLVAIESRRGEAQARARISGIRDGVVFVPFHYGDWDRPDDDAPPRAANELTRTSWDPVSKQPHFKVAAVRVRKLRESDGTPAPAPAITASAPEGEVS